MVSLQDYSEVGSTETFMDEPQFEAMEMQMMERGYLDDRKIANMFNLLRSSDLIWANVINNYLLGQKPPALDMLYWNSDGARMARAAHSFYIRNTYLENNLVKAGKVELMGRPIELGRITSAVYAVGAEKDHIVPWKSAWKISKLVDGTTHFTLAASGHIAGMISPPEKARGYWTGGEGQYETGVDPVRWTPDPLRRSGAKGWCPCHEHDRPTRPSTAARRWSSYASPAGRSPTSRVSSAARSSRCARGCARPMSTPAPPKG